MLLCIRSQKLLLSLIKPSRNNSQVGGQKSQKVALNVVGIYANRYLLVELVVC
jgi:hypothetical protein